jgi:sialidase-1
VRQLFPATVLVLSLVSTAMAQKAPASKLWLDPRTTAPRSNHLGPFVRLPGGNLLCVDKDLAYLSKDDGNNWNQTIRMFPEGGVTISNERALTVTKDGTVVVAFMNLATRNKGFWDDAKKDLVPDVKLDVWTARSTDGGKTWTTQIVQKGYSGAVRGLVQAANGNLVLVTQDVRRNPARHVTTAYYSTDDGQSWQAAKCIGSNAKDETCFDIGGHGHHDGAIEPTVERLKDGRLWMLIRTPRGKFWEAFSKDHGVTWGDFRETAIDASSAPGLLKRLADGKLLLLWNRTKPEVDAPFKTNGPPWHEKPSSYHRGELSAAISEDEGKTWSKPIVLARQAGGWLSYPYAFEPSPGRLWITTMQGGLRFEIDEKALMTAP